MKTKVKKTNKAGGVNPQRHGKGPAVPQKRNGAVEGVYSGKHTKAHVVRIGNSKGIRIPQNLLRESQLGYEVDLEAKPGMLIVRASKGPRAGWEEAFDRMSANRDDELLDNGGAETDWDRKHWKW